MRPCHLCPVPRDRQRARVYTAEVEVREALGNGRPFGTLADCKRWARQIVDSEWWLSRFQHAHIVAVRRLPAEDVAEGWAADSDPRTGVLQFGRKAYRTDFILAHELAHLAQPHGTADHGPEFALAFVALTDHLCEPAFRPALEDAFRRNRVRVAAAPIPHVEYAA